MSQSDTESLKALVAKWRKEAWHGPGETQYRMGRGHSADELESALERMLASQMGEPVAWVDTRVVHFDDTMVMGKGYDWFGWESLREEMHTLQASFAVWPNRYGDKERWSFYCTVNGLIGLELYSSKEQAKQEAEAVARSLAAAPAAGMDADSAPPLAEPDVEAAALEIYRSYVKLFAGWDKERILKEISANIRKHLRPTQQTEGEWVRVPREPTEEMRTAAVNVGYEGDMDQFRGDWAAMLAAAPQAEGK